MRSILRVLAVDADDGSRTVVADHLHGHAHLELVGAVATVTDAFALLQAQPVDLVIAALEGLEYPPRMFLDVLLRAVPATPVIVRSNTIDRAGDLLRAGARGVVHQRDPLHLLTTALLAVEAGWVYVSPTAHAALSSYERLVVEWRLTWHEVDVLRLLAQGYARCAITQALHVGVEDVDASIDQLKRRTNTTHDAQLVAWYRQQVAGSDTEDGQAGADLDELSAALTDQEYAVLALLGRGLTNRAIADELALALGTVKYYVTKLLNKLGVSSRHEAVRVAQQRGLLLRPPALIERSRRASSPRVAARYGA